VHDLVESTLKEGGVHRDDRHDALRRKAGGEGHGVLLADADVEEAIGELLEESVQAGPSRHRSGDRNRALVRLEDLADRVREHRGVLRRDLLRRPRRRDSVPFHVVGLRGSVPMTLLRLHVHEDRAVAEVAGLLEKALHREEIVSVDRTEVGEAKLLEEQVRDEQRLEAGEDPASRLFGEIAAGHVVDDLSGDVLRATIRLGSPQSFEHARHRAHVRGDAHAVVVQHDDDPRAHMADVVHRLERHTRGQRAVADDRDDVVVIALEIAGHGHTLRGGQRRPGVARAELVVLGLGAREETGDPAELP